MKRPGSSRRNKDRGAALVLVLWGAVVMSVIAAAAARQAVSSSVVVNAGAEQMRAQALADGGVRAGWTAFADGQIDSFETIWGCRNGGDLLLVQLRPEMALIDINLADEATLAALFEAAGADPSRAEQIAAGAVAYRLSGEEFGTPISEDGMPPEKPAPQALSATIAPGYFEAIEELGYLPGMDAALFRAVANDVSVHSRSPEIDVRHASPLVRRALDLAARRVRLPPGTALDGQVPPPEGSLLDLRAIAVTESGAVHVRDAVIEGPFSPDGTPTILRLVQSRLGDAEVLPASRDAPPCATGFADMARPR